MNVQEVHCVKIDDIMMSTGLCFCRHRIELLMIDIRLSAIDNVPFSSCFGVGYLIITWLIYNHI